MKTTLLKISGINTLLLFGACVSCYAFSSGNRVQCTSNLQVRPSAGTNNTPTTTEALGSRGTITGSSQTTSGFTWWPISWDNGYSGWSAQDFLAAVPGATTGAATSITSSSAQLNGTVNPSGVVTSAYFEYGLSTSYGATASAVNVGSGTSNVGVQAILNPIISNGAFHYRVVATNGSYTTYGQDVAFNTLAAPPSATTNAASNITSGSATLNATVNPNNSSTTVYFQFGLSTSYGANTSSVSIGSGTTAVSVPAATGPIIPNGTIHYRVVATNSGGTSYGQDVTFNTLAAPPVVTTNAATNISSNFADFNATVNPNNSSTTVYFQFGLSTSYGSNTTTASIGSGTISSSVQTGSGSIVSGGAFHYRAVATNSGGTTYGQDVTFNTPAAAPAATTGAATNITSGSAILNASVNPNNSATTAYFEFGLSTSYGAATPASSVGSGTTSLPVQASTGSIAPGSTFHYRVVAYNDGGTTYGQDATFTTSGATPLPITSPATGVTSSAATLNGLVNPNNFTTTSYFEYGTGTSYGTATSSVVLSAGSSAAPVQAQINGLTAGTSYHYRVVAYSSNGTSYGQDATFTTLAAALPSVQTSPATAITAVSAVISGTVLDTGGSAIVDRRFDWGTTTPLSNAVYSGAISVSGGTFSTTLTGLTPGVTYYFRAWVKNGSLSNSGVGTGWGIGSILSFTTPVGTKPNLAPYQPPGWSGNMVVSTVSGSLSDSPALTAGDTLYVSWAVINSDAGPVVSTFYTNLYVDGALAGSWTTAPPLAASQYDARAGFSVGSLSVGTHTLTLKTDATGTVAESNENDNQVVKTITVAASQIQPVTGLSVSGRVLRQASRLPLAGAMATLAGKTATTSGDGTFSLANVDLSQGAVLAVSLGGYLSHSEVVSAPANVRSITVPDVLLTVSSGTKPVIEWLRPDVAGTYLYGFGFTPKLTAHLATVTGSAPAAVRFYANGKLFATQAGAGPEYSTTLDLDSYLTASLLFGTNTISAVATNVDGIDSDSCAIQMPFIPIPSALAAFFDPSLAHGPALDELGFDLELLGEEEAITLPTLGKFGFKFGIDASFDYTVRDGSWEVALGLAAEGKQGKRGRRPNLPALTRSPKMKLYIGNKEIDATLNATASGTATSGAGIVLKDMGASIDLSANLEVWRFGLDNVIDPGGLVFSSTPGFNDILKVQQVIVYATPDLHGTADITASPFKINGGTVGGACGIELSYEPSFYGFDLQIYGGGKISADFGCPAPVIRKLDFDLYGGCKVSRWGIELKEEGTWEAYHYPASNSTAAVPQPALGLKAAPMLLKSQATAWHAMERPWRARGTETFAASANDSANAPAASALASLRLAASSPAASPQVMNVSGMVSQMSGDPGQPAQEVLPMLSNVFPGARPALASRGNQLMLLYARDTGVENTVQFTEIDSLFYDGTSWSPPTAVAASPCGQFAPQAAFDGAGNTIAVWEQIKDPAFNGTDLQSTALQIELVSATWDPAAQAWGPAAALTDNAWSDHSPRLAGPLANGDVILTWIQNEKGQLTGTGNPGDATNSRVMTMQWHSATAQWGAASTLVDNMTGELSDSLAAAAGKAVYVWNTDGDGNLADLSDTELYYRIYDAASGLWGATARYTNDSLPDTNAKVVLDAAGGVYVVWQRGSDLVVDKNFLRAPVPLRSDSGTLGFADFALTAGPNGNLVVIWEEMSNAGADAHYRVFDPASSTWSLDTLLTNDSAVERSFAPVWDNAGNLVLAYDATEVTTTTKTVTTPDGGTTDIANVPQPGQVNLLLLRRALATDLGFGSGGLTAQGSTFLSGDTVTLKTTVRNTGNVAVQNPAVAFYDGDPAAGGTLIQSVTIAGWLKASDEMDASVLWTVPAAAGPHTIYAKIDPDNQVTESDETNNLAALPLNGADLQADYVSGSVLRDGSVRVVVRVTNLGSPASGPTTLKLWPAESPGTDPLATVHVGALNPGDSADIPVQLPPGSQAEGQTAYRLTVDEDNVAGDGNRSNNEVDFTLDLFIDDDGDGIPHWWEVAHGMSDSNAADADADWDGDGFTNKQEYLAGTDPNDASSKPRMGQINSLQSADGQSVTTTVSWPSVAGHLYILERSFDLKNWVPVATDLEATPPLNSTADVVSPPPQQVFYRIQAK